MRVTEASLTEAVKDREDGIPFYPRDDRGVFVVADQSHHLIVVCLGTLIIVSCKHVVAICNFLALLVFGVEDNHVAYVAFVAVSTKYSNFCVVYRGNCGVPAWD